MGDGAVDDPATSGVAWRHTDCFAIWTGRTNRSPNLHHARCCRKGGAKPWVQLTVETGLEYQSQALSGGTDFGLYSF